LPITPFKKSLWPAADYITSWQHFFYYNPRKKAKTTMAKYSKTAQRKVKKVMHELKEGTLRSGRSEKKVTSRKQALAIGLSEARKKGAKVPRRKSNTSSK
jgi:Family of unknown function (DUF6496)